MKYMKIILIVVFIAISCKSQKKNDLEDEEMFVIAYKTSVLYSCINEATDGNFSKFSKENNDLALSVPVAVLQHAEINKAKALGISLSKKIKSIDYADYEGKKPIFSNCVEYSFSKEVDSLARLEYKKIK